VFDERNNIGRIKSIRKQIAILSVVDLRITGIRFLQRRRIVQEERKKKLKKKHFTNIIESRHPIPKIYNHDSLFRVQILNRNKAWY
jgi:hypothetical protein